ncbi:MAG: thioredoxin family protein, partial [Phycisphaerales bacterium]|nr:thioredoxin family protein [Phycisphaerales bacterium]
MTIRSIRRTAMLSIVGLLLAAPTAMAGGEGWVHDNMDKAKELARSEGKFILMDFTGSDWCGWCIRLNDEVFSKDHFKTEAPKQFVLAEFDYPQKKAQTDEVKAANKKHQATYAIGGFPTIILADAEGKAFAQTGYRPDGPEKYMEHLNTLVSNRTKIVDLLKQATTLEGIEKAQVLDTALSMENMIVHDAAKYEVMIIAADADDAAGLKSKAAKRLFDLRMTAAQASDPAQAEVILNQLATELPDLTEEQRQQVDMTRVYIALGAEDADRAIAAASALAEDANRPADFRQQAALMIAQANVLKKDHEAAMRAIDRAIAIDPDSQFGMMLSGQRDMISQQIQMQIDAMKSDSEKSDG